MQTETMEELGVGLIEHVVVFEVSMEQSARVWAWCFVDLARGYGWQRIGWTSIGGGEDLGELAPNFDWTRERGGSNPVKLFEYDVPMLGQPLQ